MPNTARFGLGLKDSKSVFNAKFDNGKYPAVIGLNNSNILVEIHKTSTVGSSTLRYCVSKVDDKCIAWGDMHSHTKGNYPCIAINDHNTVIELHMSSDTDSKNLFWSSGSINSTQDDIKWDTGDASKFDEGYYPSVALMNDGTVLAAHLGSDNSVYCAIGSLSGGKLSWYASKAPKVPGAKTAISGYAACIAVNNKAFSVGDNSYTGVAIMVYQANDNNNYYHTGLIKSNGSKKEIEWSAATRFDSQGALTYGESFKNARQAPSVGINDNCEVVVTAFSNDRTFADATAPGVVYMYNAFYDKKTGKLTFNEYNKSTGAIAFDNGCRARVAVNNNYAVQVHDDGYDTNPGFWGTSCKMIDRANIMTAAKVLDRPLWQVTLLGTHDSCTYSFVNNGQSRSACAATIFWSIPLPASMTPDDTARAQQDCMLDQLRGGVRYIDIRVCKNQDIDTTDPAEYFYTYHSIIAVKVADVLDDIATFMEEAPTELLVLNYSHLCSFKDKDHADLIALTNTKLGKYLSSKVNAYSSASVYGYTIKTLLEGEDNDGNVFYSSRVLVVYQDQKVDDDGYNVIPVNLNKNYLYKTRTDKNMYTGYIATLDVYDCYSKTNDYDDMKTKQLRRMGEYATQLPFAAGATPALRAVTSPKASSKNKDLDNTGDCLPVADQQLYLLSWTLTPSATNATGIHNLSTNPSRSLPRLIYETLCNNSWKPKYLINVLYIDFYSDGRGADMVYLLNENFNKS